MNRRIRNWAYCVFRTPVEGSRDGRVVLAQHQEIDDPETGGHYTVKMYRSTKAQGPEGDWLHTEIRLEPDSDAPGYEAIVLRDVEESEVRVIAELVQVLPGGRS